MRRRRGAATALATLLVVATACAGGEGDGDAAPSAPAPDPASGPASDPAPSSAPPASARVLDVVALSNAGGGTQSVPAPVAQPDDAAAYVAALEPPGRVPLLDAIDAAAVPPGLELRAAVVEVGCDEPAEVLLEGGDDLPWTVRAVGSKASVQCLLPVTFVALVAVPA